ncbi:MAG: amidohydrolase, partial [Microthrixaceae bacterium]|nr:amidohydrolase [Microthrixaceae bacterium]
MGMPKNIEIIDTMIGLPSHDRREIYKFLAADLRD